MTLLVTLGWLLSQVAPLVGTGVAMIAAVRYLRRARSLAHGSRPPSAPATIPTRHLQRHNEASRARRGRMAVAGASR